MAKPKVVDATGARIEPTSELTPEQVLIWNEIVDSLPADFFRPADRPLLAAFCKARSFYNLAAGEMETYGITIEQDNGKRLANPAHQILVTQASAMAQLSVKLRLSPSSRISEKKAATMTEKGATTGRPWEHQG